MALSPFDSEITGPLVGDPQVAGLFYDHRQIREMLRVEAALARAQAKLQLIPVEAAEKISEAAETLQIDPARLSDKTARNGVPVSALVAELRQALDADAARWVHYGATSQDIVDTALVLQLRALCDLIDTHCLSVIRKLAGLSQTHRATLATARTRTQQAVPTSFGLKLAGWARPLSEERARLSVLRPHLLRVQFGGAGGNLSVFGARGAELSDALAAELDLTPVVPAWHAERQSLLAFADGLVRMTGALGKVGQDVAQLCQSEVGELRIAGAGGSSTMPQKTNPVAAEVLVALARHAAAQLSGLHQAQLHAQERDGAAWTLEWLALPQICATAGGALARADELLDALEIDADRMAENAAGGRGLVLAEAAAFALADHLPRSQAQDLVAQACRQTMAENRHLFDVLADLTDAEVDWDQLRQPKTLVGGSPDLVDRALVSLAGDERT